MVKLFKDEMGGRDAEVVLDDPRSGAGIVSWFDGKKCWLPKFLTRVFLFMVVFDSNTWLDRNCIQVRAARMKDGLGCVYDRVRFQGK